LRSSCVATASIPSGAVASEMVEEGKKKTTFWAVDLVSRLQLNRCAKGGGQKCHGRVTCLSFLVPKPSEALKSRYFGPHCDGDSRIPLHGSSLR
jgi:hypothetical protein